MAAIAASVVVAAGCALMTPAPVETHKRVLDKVPAELPQARRNAAAILVLLPDAKATYDTTEMAYATRPHEIEYFARNEWAEKPAQMLHALLVKTLRETGYFKEVLTPSQPGPHKYALRSELVELRQDFTAAKPVVNVAMRLQLVDSSERIIASRELSAAEPMGEKSPSAGVAAANDAVARMLQEAARFVLASAG